MPYKDDPPVTYLQATRDKVTGQGSMTTLPMSDRDKKLAKTRRRSVGFKGPTRK